MITAAFEEWSLRQSFFHARDARAKLGLTVLFLIAVALQRDARPVPLLVLPGLLVVATASSRLPLGGLLLRASAALPFAVTFAAVTWFAGDAERAVGLMVKSAVSAFAVLLLISTTRLPDLARAMGSFGVPRFLIEVVEMLYRYLAVLGAQAGRMRMAAAARGGGWTRVWSAPSLDEAPMRAAAGAVSMLFAASYARAEGVHRAMLARGYHGSMPVLRERRWSAADTGTALLGGVVIVLGAIG